MADTMHHEDAWLAQVRPFSLFPLLDTIIYLIPFSYPPTGRQAEAQPVPTWRERAQKKKQRPR